MSKKKQLVMPLFEESKSELTHEEQMILTRNEELIAQNVATFHQMGQALAEIKEKKLYREHHKTFDEYCKKVFGVSRTHTYRLISSSEVMDNLSQLKEIPLPESERQVRPLISLSPELQREAWKRVITLSQHKKVTARDIKQIVKELGSENSDVSTESLESDALLHIDNSQLYYMYRRSLETGNYSHKKDSQWPVSEFETNQINAYAMIKPDSSSMSSIKHAQEKVADFVESLDDLTADVLDIITTQWLKDATDPDSTILLKTNDFLNYRGLKAKTNSIGGKGGYNRKEKKKIAKHVEVLANTWIKVFEMNVTVEEEGKLKRKKWEGESRAVVISSRVGETNIGENSEEAIPIHWRIRPGDVFAKFLLGPGRQTALLSKKALEFDPYREKWEKRLTRYLAWQWRNRQKTGNFSKPILVKTILKTLDILDDKGELKKEQRPGRIKERLEQALFKIEEHQVISAWEYQNSDESVIGKKGWWNHWLEWQILITPPESVINHYKYQIKNQQYKTIPGQSARALNPQEIINARTNRGLSQNQAAKQIGISQTTLSRFEKGKSVDPKNFKKLQHWLQLSPS